MQAAAQVSPVSRTGQRAGWIMTGLFALFMLFDGVLHTLRPAMVVEASARLGYAADVWPPIGVLELLCLALYLFPRTSVLGAILLTGHLGGAIAIHVRVNDPLFSHILFPVYVGVLLWGGLYLRDERLRALFPLRR